MIHEFQNELDYSLLASDEPFWESVYFEAFPTMVDLRIETDLSQQKLGVDRVITLADGRDILVDEKKRRDVWQDILLEYVSNDSTGAPGWIEKDLEIDYIAYAFMPVRTVYMFPWDLLKGAWNHNKIDWMVNYKDIKGANAGYVTHSIAVPITTLCEAVDSFKVVQL